MVILRRFNTQEVCNEIDLIDEIHIHLRQRATHIRPVVVVVMVVGLLVGLLVLVVLAMVVVGPMLLLLVVVGMTVLSPRPENPKARKHVGNHLLV